MRKAVPANGERRTAENGMPLFKLNEYVNKREIP
jgi:hypothetical protein